MELLEEKKRLQAEENRRAELSLMDSLSTRGKTKANLIPGIFVNID